MDIDLENCLYSWNYLIIYVFVLLCDIFCHIDFESDLNSLFGNFNALNENYLNPFNGLENY